MTSVTSVENVGLLAKNEIKAYEGTLPEINSYFDYQFSVDGDEPLYAYLTLESLSDDLDLTLYKNLEPIFSSKNSGAEPESLFRVLSAGDYIARVEFVEEIDYIYDRTSYILEFDTQSFLENSVIPNDTYFINQWGLFNTGQAEGNANEDILAPEAWNIISTSSDVIVAVIDSGIDIFHEDLDDNIWNNDLELIGFENGIDDDGNGYIDDHFGWNFKAKSNLLYPDAHGTHVAGIIGAEGNNDQGIAGVTWDVQLMSLDVFNGGEGANDQDIIDAIYYAADNGSDVINLSLGETYPGITFEEYKSQYSDHYQLYYDAFEYATNKGAVVVIAAGNANADLDKENISLPAEFSRVLDGVMSVAAVGNTGDISTYSNQGGVISIAAPGGDFQEEASEIYSTLPDNSYDFKSGTSMAAPIVSGAAALLIAAAPFLTPAEVENILLSTSDKYKDLEDFVQSGNFLNLEEALNYVIAYYTETETNGTTGLITDHLGGAYALNPEDTPAAITFNGSQMKDGFFSGWKIIGAETIDSVNNVAWKHTDGTLSIWNTDAEWNYIEDAFFGAAHSLKGLDWETKFDQDFNDDFEVGAVLENSETIGSTYLVTDSLGGAYARIATSSLDEDAIEITYEGSQMKDDFFAGWSIVGAETIDSVNNVAWKHTDGTLSIWNTDAEWNYIEDAFFGAAITSEGLDWETKFDQDFNGDTEVGIDPLAQLKQRKINPAQSE